MLTKGILAILRDNLALASGDRLLIFTDKPAPRETLTQSDALRRRSLRDFAYMVEEQARTFCREVRFLEFPARGGHGMEPPVKLWGLAFGQRALDAMEAEGLLRPLMAKKSTLEQIGRAISISKRHSRGAASAVVALTNYSTSHTTFRSLLTEVCGARYASMPLFDLAMMQGPMSVDYKRMGRSTRKVASMLSKADSVRIKTPEGTDITLSLRGRKAHADTGLLHKPGSFGNLPAGEAYVAPLEGTAEGRLVLLWAPTRKLASPVTVHVESGMAVRVEGKEEYAAALDAALSKRADNRNVAELGIGTNPLASRPDNILESEKILGTIHIALGDNSSFGGRVKTPFHQDFVFFHPSVTLLDKSGAKTALLDRGKLLV